MITSMCQFFCRNIIENCRSHPVRSSKTLGKITHGSSYFAIRPTVLAHDKLGQLCVRSFNVYRILKSFFIIPHNLSASSFLFPGKRLFHPLPGSEAAVVCCINGQRSVEFCVFFQKLISSGTEFTEIFQCPLSCG